MGRHDSTPLTKARDELMSHIQRCGVLDAEKEHRKEWLDDTIDYMAGRYTRLSELELAQLELMGRQYLKPVIPHGKEHTALNRGAAPEGPVSEAEESRTPEALQAA